MVEWKEYMSESVIVQKLTYFAQIKSLQQQHPPYRTQFVRWHFQRVVGFFGGSSMTCRTCVEKLKTCNSFKGNRTTEWLPCPLLLSRSNHRTFSCKTFQGGDYTTTHHTYEDSHRTNQRSATSKSWFD